MTHFCLLMGMMGIAGLLFSGGPCGAREPIAMCCEEDTLILQAFLRHTESSLARFTPEAVAKIEQPEDICWQWAQYLAMPLVAYQITAQTAYLDKFVQALDVLLTRLRPGPDGFLGFRGLPYELFRNPANPHAEIDVDIAEFEVTQRICDFVEIVRQEAPLAQKYAEPVQRYLELAQRHLAGPKWEQRGCYVDLGTQGAVFRMPAECGNNRDNLTNPHNKQSKICRAYLALYRVSGEDEYFRRAIKLGVRFKRMLRLQGDCYVWHYWDPAGDWDRRADNPQQWKHWIGPEHRGGYHALTVAMAAALYDHGVVFDRTDMERFANTQLKICWNGSLEAPEFRTTGGQPSRDPQAGAFIAPALAPFAPAVAEYCFGRRATQERLQQREHGWRGGVGALEYLTGKYLRPLSAEPTKLSYREKFASRPENAAFLKEMEYLIPSAQP